MPRLEKEAIDATEREAERSEEWTEGEHSNNLDFFGRLANRQHLKNYDFVFVAQLFGTMATAPFPFNPVPALALNILIAALHVYMY
jgi:hypothetical protein